MLDARPSSCIGVILMKKIIRRTIVVLFAPLEILICAAYCGLTGVGIGWQNVKDSWYCE